MKIYKLIFTLCLAIAFTNCSDNSNKEIALDYTVANVAGTYKIKALTANLTNTAVTQGVTATISTATETGDTFDADLNLDANGEFTLKGTYRIVTSVTPIGGTATITPSIKILDTSGSYTVNTQTRTISFTPVNVELLEGLYAVAVFDQNTFSITQNASKTDGGITTITDSAIVFERQ